MKRSGPPERRQPLSRGESLPPGQPLRRQPLPRTSGREARPKSAHPRRPRQAGEQQARERVRERSQGTCEGCAQEVATDWAHRKARSQGGAWCASNGLHLGRKCHAWSHANPVAAREQGWIVRSTDDPATFPVLHAWLGLVLLRADGSVESVEEEAA